jgi:hypothetical protein
LCLKFYFPFVYPHPVERAKMKMSRIIKVTLWMKKEESGEDY